MDIIIIPLSQEVNVLLIKKKILIVFLCLIAVIIMFVIRIMFMQYTNYWKVIGRTYEEVVSKMGEPDHIIDFDDSNEVYYDKRIYMFDGIKRDYLCSLISTDEELRFGVFHIGIGSSKKTIETVYFFKEKIKGKDNQYCVKDGNAYVTFTFNHNLEVTKIIISYSEI